MSNVYVLKYFFHQKTIIVYQNQDQVTVYSSFISISLHISLYIVIKWNAGCLNSYIINKDVDKVWFIVDTCIEDEVND